MHCCCSSFCSYEWLHEKDENSRGEKEKNMVLERNQYFTHLWVISIPCHRNPMQKAFHFLKCKLSWFISFLAACPCFDDVLTFFKAGQNVDINNSFFFFKPATLHSIDILFLIWSQVSLIMFLFLCCGGLGCHITGSFSYRSRNSEEPATRTLHGSQTQTKCRNRTIRGRDACKKKKKY